MSHSLRTNLERAIPPQVVGELLEAYSEAKRNFYLGGFRLSEVEGGRFCEAAFRVLEHVTGARFTPLNRRVDAEKLFQRLANLPQGSCPDSLRLHIPRALRVVYDVRNNRDAAHLADGIDPNLQDATLVASVLDWVLAEFIRLYHSVSAGEAQDIVDDLVTRRAPVVEEFGDFLKVLNPRLSASDHILVLLYQCGKEGASYDQLASWAKPSMRANLRRTLSRLVSEKAFSHYNDSRYYITRAGALAVEENEFYRMPE
jgi:hypothetical protein